MKHEAGDGDGAPEGDADPRDHQNARFARRLLALRRLRQTTFGAIHSADPVWAMLLELYIQTREGRPVSISSLSLSAGVPATTALRCINSMVSSGLLARRGDPRDGRRVFVVFGEGAEESIDSFLARSMAELGVSRFD